MATENYRNGLRSVLAAAAFLTGAAPAIALEAPRVQATSADSTPVAGDRKGDKVGEFLFLVFSNPVAGREEEFERWCTGQHVADVVNAASIDTGRRYRLSGEGPHRYLALYQVKCDDPQTNAAALQNAMSSGSLKMSDAFDYDTAQAMVFIAHSPLVTR